MNPSIVHVCVFGCKDDREPKFPRYKEDPGMYYSSMRCFACNRFMLATSLDAWIEWQRNTLTNVPKVF